MAITLSKVMQRAWRELGHMVVVKATGGTTTTVIDTNSRYTTDDALLGGTVVVIRDSAGASAAPENEFGRISNYDAASFTWTMDALTTAVASGDTVGLVRAKIPATQMIEAVNDALSNLGFIRSVYSGITIGSSQTEYTLPVDLKMTDIVDIIYPALTGDSDNNQYYSIKSRCRVETAAPGSTGILYTPQLTSGRVPKIIHDGYHARVSVYSSVISETIPEELIVAAAIDKALSWLVSKTGDSALGTFIIQRWNDAKQTLQNVKVEQPKWKMKRQPRFFVLGENERGLTGDQGIYDYDHRFS